MRKIKTILVIYIAAAVFCVFYLCSYLLSVQVFDAFDNTFEIVDVFTERINCIAGFFAYNQKGYLYNEVIFNDTYSSMNNIDGIEYDNRKIVSMV